MHSLSFAQNWPTPMLKSDANKYSHADALWAYSTAWRALHNDRCLPQLNWLC